MQTIQEQYNSEIIDHMMKEMKIGNSFAVPRVDKIVVNIGAGEAVSNKKVIEKVVEQMATITGQKPVVTKARKSISSFKIRKGLPIGAKVTLRGKKMYAFLEKLIKVVIPRLKDFRGIDKKSVDMHGNLNLGFREQTIFPEIEYDKIDRIRGLEVTIVTTSRDREKGTKLFELLGIPFTKEE